MRDSGTGSAISFVPLAVMWLVVAWMIHATSASAASFRGLGDLSGGDFHSESYAISGDGSTVVGFSYTASGREAFRWTEAEGMVGLGDLPGEIFPSLAYGASVDGSIVVGSGRTETTSQAFRWTSGGSIVALEGVDGVALDVSAVGSVSVGVVFKGDPPYEACQWAAGGGLWPLGYPAGYDASFVSAVSDDGSVIVGFADDFAPSALQAFIWTWEDGWVGLGYLNEGDDWSQSIDISGDGSVVLGGSGSFVTGEWEAFLWTESGGMVGLGEVSPRSISQDGSVVLGETSEGNELLLWDAVRGWRPVREILEDDLGLDVSGWTLDTSYLGHLISDDGLRITGIGTDPNGNTQAWIADLSEPPEPVPALSLPGLLILACSLGLGGVLSARRRHSNA